MNLIMKKLYKAIVAFAALAFAATSCDITLPEKEVPHQPGEPDVEGCYDVFFPTQDAAGSHTYDPTADPVVEIAVVRKNTVGEITVPVKFTVSEDGIFEAEDLKFLDGQAESVLTVRFDKAEMGTTYEFTAQIVDPQYASKYSQGAKSLDFSVLRVEWKYLLNPQTGLPAMCDYTCDYYGFGGQCKVKYYDVNGVRTCMTETVPVEYQGETYYGFWQEGESMGENELSFTWYTGNQNVDGNDVVALAVNDMFFNTNYKAMVQSYDWYTYFTIVNPQAALAGMSFVDFAKKYGGNYALSYYENGAFYIHPAYYYMMEVGGWKIDTDDLVIMAEGFIRTDYTLEAEADFSDMGEVPVYFTAGRDVKTIKYTVAPGSLAAAAVQKLAAAIVDGTAENIEVLEGEDIIYDEDYDESYAAVSLSFEETGLYTVVAVSYDESGAEHEVASVVLTYVTAEDEEEYAVVASVGIEALPERYGLPEYSTAAYYIAGKDLTDVHFTIVSTASITSQEVLDQLLKEVKYDAEKYAVSADELEQINAVGGLYDYVTSLKDNTQYALVVWATNGMLEKFYTKAYTTPKKPYEWNLLGKGTLTEPFTTMFGEDPLVIPVDVYQEKNNPGLYMYKGTGLALANWFYEQDMSAYEGQYWDDEGIIFDATDPSKVVIDNQYYGFNAGSSYGWPVITTIANGQTVGYGKLADGHLTLTARLYLVGMGTSFYYGPAGYDLALPSVAQASNVVVKNYVEKPMVDESGRSAYLQSDLNKFDYKPAKVKIAADPKSTPVKVKKIEPRKKADKKRATKQDSAISTSKTDLK